MDSPQRYAIRYTETALLDMGEKADYIILGVCTRERDLTRHLQENEG